MVRALMWPCVSVIILLLCSNCVLPACFEPSPAFPLPKLSKNSTILRDVFQSIESSVNDEHLLSSWPTSSFSIEITSSKETLWSYYHTASERNVSRYGAEKVDGDSVYRIASITKTFTTLGILQQQKAGKLSLEDPVTAYIAELAQPQTGTIPWKDITLRSLASQLSGIPREFSGADVINYLEDPTEIGLPPIGSREGLLACHEYSNFKIPCGRKEMLDSLKRKAPLYPPNQKSTYSNNNFDLLGLVLENVTGMPYSEYMKAAIFEPLEMASSSLSKPDDTHAVIPKGPSFWDTDDGIEQPTGSIYSSASDMSKYARYILTHYNGITSLNWLNPASFSGSMNSFYGIPFEIFRSDKILRTSKRPITFVTKSGGELQYHSFLILIPEYDVAVTILVAGSKNLKTELRERVTVPLVRGLETLAWRQVNEKYSGTYVYPNSTLNSSVTMTANPTTGLTVTRFVSNGSDMFRGPLVHRPDPDTDRFGWHVQLSPTLLYRNESTHAGELWRAEVLPNRPDDDDAMKIWDDSCNVDVDQIYYAEVPIIEFVFYKGEDGKVQNLELSAFRVMLVKEDEKTDMDIEGGKGQMVFQG